MAVQITDYILQITDYRLQITDAYRWKIDVEEKYIYRKIKILHEQIHLGAATHVLVTFVRVFLFR